MICELHTIKGETITVEGEYTNIFCLYNATMIEQKWETHWFKIAHTQTGIILLDQAKYLEERGKIINDRQMKLIVKGLNPKILPEPRYLDLFVRNGCNGALPVVNHVKDVIAKVTGYY